jgi:cytochrome c-type biogenesis protein CcmH/NrfF
MGVRAGQWPIWECVLGSVHLEAFVSEYKMNSPANDYPTVEEEVAFSGHTTRIDTQAPDSSFEKEVNGDKRLIRLFTPWIGWIMLLLIVAGGGIYLTVAGHGSRPVTIASRVSYIDSIVRCPDVDSCGGTIPVSDTNAPVAIEIKDAVSADVHAGMSTSEVKRLLVDRYGPSILLSPSASGLGLLLWLLPVIAGICTITVLAVVLFRRSMARQDIDTYSQSNSVEAVDGDLDGDVGVVDGVADVAADDPAGVAGDSRVDSRGDIVDIKDDNESAGRGMRYIVRKYPKVLLIGGISCIVVAVAIAAFSSFHARLQGEVATGNISLSRGQEIQRRLVQASAAENSGNDVTALKLYNDVLAMDPNQVQALSESGWITYETGVLSGNSRLMAAGEARVKEAMKISPGSFAPHLYLGTIYLHQGSASEAAAQYAEFLKDNPPKEVKADAGLFMRQAFARQPAHS